ncbi:acyltransferase [Flavobacterium sp.]|uniref:acyltransferase n=1 Tax=Flavobacterium sp. TaxID=239 RepID=UPI0025E5F0CF|nr:acyltransferase [Flavobacterium sp.]
MRLQYIDSLKGFLIILVVLGHVIQITNKNFDNDIIFRYIYSFHMPLFFVLSGFVNFKKEFHFKVLYFRLFQLIIPFFSWWFIKSVVIKNESFIDSFVILMKSPDTGLWFLWVLFFCICIFYFLNFIANKLSQRPEIILVFGALFLYIIFLLSNFRWFGFQFISWYFMFFIIGFFIHKYEFIINKYNYLILLVTLILFPVLAFFSVIKGLPLFYKNIDLGLYFSYIYKFIVALCGIFLFFNIFKSFFEKHKYLHIFFCFFKNLGSVTLGIYATHTLFIEYLFDNQYYSLSYNLQLILFLIFSLTASYFLIFLIKKIKILKILLLGEIETKSI